MLEIIEMSLTMMLVGGATTVIGILTALWSRAKVKNIRAERDRVQEANYAIEAAGKRLEAARQASRKPIDPKKRDDFEGQP